MSDSDTKLILSSIGGFSQRIADLCVALNTVVEKITPTNSVRDAIALWQEAEACSTYVDFCSWRIKNIERNAAAGLLAAILPGRVRYYRPKLHALFASTFIPTSSAGASPVFT
jgi:hypothetical protein